VTIIVSCPMCDEDIDLDDDVELSEVVVCSHCENELEIISTDPVTLAEFEEEEK
jgi:alpha-aminoadipate/glutamate carrier protein LysW